MKILCEHIERVVSLSTLHGLRVLDTSESWAKVNQVVYMSDELSADLKSELLQQPALRYWCSKRTPHNAAENGYMCDECKVGISFPVRD